LACGFASARAHAQGSTTPDQLDLNSRSSVVQGSGARALGMGGAFLARPDDATAASWNPAGLSYLRSPEISLVGASGSLNIQKIAIDGELITEDSRSGHAADFLAVTYPLAIKSVSGSLQLSYQRAISFDADRTIETLAAPTQQLTTSGGFDVIALGTGLQLSRRVRAGLTVNRWFNGYTATQDRSQSPVNGGRPARQTSLDFSISGFNVNLGLIWSPIDRLNLGAVYKTGFTAQVDLSRSRIDYNSAGVEVSRNSHSSSDVRLDMPSAYGFGASWRPKDQLTVSADFTHSNWSKALVHNYFTLTQTGVQTFDVLYYPTLVTDPPQKDTAQFRAGVEYVIVKGSLKWPVRVGYVADRQLFQTFNQATGDSNHAPPLYNGFTAGTGLVIGRILVDFAYLYEYGSYQEVDISDLVQDSHVHSHRFFVSLIYRHKR
jgi:long-subunit fatty acid transport protein